MKKILYICDRCKREIEENPTKIYVDELDRENSDFVYSDPYPEMKNRDFCKTCGEFFVGLINRHCEKGIPAVPNKEFEKAVQEMIKDTQPSDPPPEKKTRSKLDTGKIVALRKAGWTIKAIAEEMSCSEQAVYNVLKKAGLTVDKKKALEPKPTEQSQTN